jgi:hypothetical protein
MMERLVTLLPHPDSPTTPNVLPRPISKLTPSSAVTMPSSVLKDVTSPSTFRTISCDEFLDIIIKPSRSGRAHYQGVRKGASAPISSII